jgi:ceramide glucosyltransferase
LTAALVTFGWLCGALACAGAVYSLIAALLVRRFFCSKAVVTTEFPAVTILKPLKGDEPGLRAHLESFCRQDYPGEVQFIFGVQDPNDPAIRCIEALRRDLPDHDIQLVVDAREYGANRKVSNLVNIMREARHDILVLADSDIGVQPSYLRNIVAALSAPGTGLVTCLYRGESVRGLCAELSAIAIDYHFLPSVIFGLAVGLARPCVGATIALRRSVLEQIGGFDAFANHLADDNAIGEAVRNRGFGVAVPPMTVVHACTEQRFGDLISHELRWARTIRAVDQMGFAGSIITHPLPIAFAGVVASGFSLAATGVLLFSLICRVVLLRQVDRSLGVHGRHWWLWPVRDFLSLIIFTAAFFVNSVTWRGRRLRVDPYGILSSSVKGH